MLRLRIRTDAARSLGRDATVWLIGHVKIDPHVHKSALRAFETASKLIDGERLAPGSDQFRHVEFNRGVTPRQHATAALVRAKPIAVGPAQRASATKEAQ